MIKKILKNGFLIILTILAIKIVILNFHNRSINRANQSIKLYEPKTVYEEKYDIKDYVDESLNSYGIFRRFMLGSMFEYDEINNYLGLVQKFFFLINNFFSEQFDYAGITASLQYFETSQIELTNNQCDVYNVNNYICTYEYSGYIPEVEQVITGDVSIFQNGQYNLVVSFLDENGSISPYKARMLADDSMAEMLAYLIIENTQEINETNMTPDDASEYFYGCSLEKLAGSISYHASLAYILVQGSVTNKDVVYEKVQEVNINQDSSDDFFVNRIY